MSKKKRTIFRRGRRNFFTGLAVVLPVIISVGIALCLFHQAVFLPLHCLPSGGITIIVASQVENAVNQIPRYFLRPSGAEFPGKPLRDSWANEQIAKDRSRLGRVPRFAIIKRNHVG